MGELIAEKRAKDPISVEKVCFFIHISPSSLALYCFIYLVVLYHSFILEDSKLLSIYSIFPSLGGFLYRETMIFNMVVHTWKVKYDGC